MVWNSRIRVLLVGLIFSSLTFLVGCSDDSPEAPEVSDPRILPPTEDILMQNYLTSVVDMSYDDLDFILHEEFRLGLLPSTIEDWDGSGNPLVGDHFDKAAMLSIHENLFGEIEGMDEHGLVVSYVESISFDVFDKVRDWEPIAAGNVFFEDYPEAYRARYSVLIHFNNPDYHRWEVDHMLDIIVLPVTLDETTGYQLLGIYGYSPFSAAGTEEISYDGVLAMYRF